MVEKEVVKEVVVTPERYANNVWGQLVEKPQHGGSIPMALGINSHGFRPLAYHWQHCPNEADT